MARVKRALAWRPSTLAAFAILGLVAIVTVALVMPARDRFGFLLAAVLVTLFWSLYAAIERAERQP